jgi:hypothetical protein
VRSEHRRGKASASIATCLHELCSHFQVAYDRAKRGMALADHRHEFGEAQEIEFAQKPIARFPHLQTSDCC